MNQNSVILVDEIVDLQVDNGRLVLTGSPQISPVTNNPLA